MKLRVLVLALLVLVSGSGMAVHIRPTDHAVGEVTPQLLPETAAAILASTVQIGMFEFASEPGGTEPGSRGLGTLVAYGSKRVVVTHDHWAHLTPNLHEVEFHNANGKLLLTLDAQAFVALVVYRDGGTMVLRAPEALNSLVAAPLGTRPERGDTLWFARRALETGRTTLEVGATLVTAVEGGAQAGSVRLRNVDSSALLPGDSGGGVWADGRLVANVWAAGVHEKRSLLRNLFGGQDVPSNLVVAALQPLNTLDASVIALAGLDVAEPEEELRREQMLEATLVE